jgi:ABC-type uncharacterized transport system ATPase subunit
VILSTHVVDDIAQTCSQLAMLVSGRVVFADSTRQLVQPAAGSVWALDTDGPARRAAAIVSAASSATCPRTCADAEVLARQLLRYFAAVTGLPSDLDRRRHGEGLHAQRRSCDCQRAR